MIDHPDIPPYDEMIVCASWTMTESYYPADVLSNATDHLINLAGYIAYNLPLFNGLPTLNMNNPYWGIPQGVWPWYLYSYYSFVRDYIND